MDSDNGEENAASPLETLNDERHRSRSPLETVAEEAEGYQPIPVTPQTVWSSYPLLVEDSTRVLLAPSLEQTLRYFFTRRGKDVTEISRSDLLIVLIYVLALETGLTPKGASLPSALRSERQHCHRSFDKRLVHHFATRLPMDWFRNSAGPYRCELELVHEKATRSNLSCALVAFCSGDMLVVNLLPHYGLKASLSTTIPISYHVPAVNADRLPFCFQYLAGLSVKVKNELLVPFRNHMYRSILTISPSLQGIPDEVLLKVMAHLDNTSINQLKRAITPVP
ncbi:uncharacterized protein LOC126561075 [Anopheles maculipalpis]|uniref:uncharacterized protein LOC126561075 n=1 Tax=Anopheles maculipalpis TaxID=1496333 RepID=UPI0021598D54|nr:uncharacterized protein LOC126561075 [Anopheles maculipalpis]